MNVYMPIGTSPSTVERTRRALESQGYDVNTVKVYGPQTGNHQVDIFDACDADDLDMAYSIVDAILDNQE